MAQEEKGRLSRKIDQICRVIFLTEDGKPKSTTLIYSFSLSLVFGILYEVYEILKKDREVD